MSDTESGLLAAIIAYPFEDTPRLAYADFLDETGRPRHANMIRRAFAEPKRFVHAEGKPAVVSYYAADLRETVSVMVAEGIPQIQLVTCRGLVEGVRLRWGLWGSAWPSTVWVADVLRRRYPLREVVFTDPPVFDAITTLDVGRGAWCWEICGERVYLEDAESRGRDSRIVALSKRWPGLTFIAPRRTVDPHD